MSKNYDMIATVDIDIASPIVDDTSFDNMLIVGPLPKAVSEKAPPAVGVYSSVDEVIAAGWCTSGDEADPVGVAAKVAFAQKPTPTQIYIAPQQFTASAIVAGNTIKTANAVVEQYVGKKEGLTGCTIAFDADSRVMKLKLTGSAMSVKNTGIFEALKVLTEDGYTISVEGTAVTDSKSFTALPVFERITALGKGDEPIQFTVNVKSVDGPDVPYGVIVHYPSSKNVDITELDYNTEPISNPQEEIEPAVATIQRAISTAGWYVVCPAGVNRAEYGDIAEYIENQEKMCIYTEMNYFGVGSDGENSSTIDKIYFRTLGIYGREYKGQPDEEVPVANQYMNVAFVAKWLSYEPGSETTAFKTLEGVSPSELSTTDMKALENDNLNYFITVGNKNITMNGKVIAGEWADIIRFRDWLKNDMQVRVVNTFVAMPKIPYTNPGIALIQNQMIASLKAGQDAGGISEDEFDESGSAIPGYTTSVPLSTSVSDSEKKTRKLPRCFFKARLSGAIHFAELSGSLTSSV